MAPVEGECWLFRRLLEGVKLRNPASDAGLARPEGLEPTTFGSAGQRSIH